MVHSHPHPGLHNEPQLPTPTRACPRTLVAGLISTTMNGPMMSGRRRRPHPARAMPCRLQNQSASAVESQGVRLWEINQRLALLAPPVKRYERAIDIAGCQIRVQ